MQTVTVMSGLGFGVEMTANTRAVGPVEVGTRPFLHWKLKLPCGLRLMRTRKVLLLYRVDEHDAVRRLPGSARSWVALRGELS